VTAGWRTVAEMQARDLLRRRAAVLLLAPFPMIWYGAEAAAGISYAVGTGILAIAWAAAAAALFAFVAARHVDLRLVQAGYRPRDLVVGRLAALLATSTTIALTLGAVMVAGSRPARTSEVFLALVLTAVISSSVGWLTAAVVPRELEGTVLLIGLVGLQVSIPVSGAANLFVPYYGPLRLTDYDQSAIGPAGPALHFLVWTAMIGVVALVLWRRHQVLATTGDAVTSGRYSRADGGTARP
jgi:hypothetical protein